MDSHDPRVLSDKEQQEFLDWFFKRWNGWRLPILSLEAKSWVGPRIKELAGLPSTNLLDGRIKFDGDRVKGRADGHVTLPENLFDELRRIAGPKYVFESFANELRAIHTKKKTAHCTVVKPFSPKRMVAWLQRQLDAYRKGKGCVKGTPGYFKLHNFRGTAMTKAQDAGVSLDDASIFFRCHPDTIRRHYVSRDKLRVADEVARKMARLEAERKSSGGGGSTP